MKVGIIGLGHGKRVLFESFKISKLNVHGVCSKNSKKAEVFSEKNNITKKYKKWIDLVKDKEIEIIAIAVPALHQIKIIRECIKFNKIIFCEKPLGVNFRSIKKIINEIKHYKKNIIIDYIFREHNSFKKFKNLLLNKINFKRGNVEVIFKMQSYVFKKNMSNWKLKPSLGGGLINLYLSHIIDYLIYFFGRIYSIQINKQNKYEISKNLDFSISFESGIYAKIKIEANNPNHEHIIKYYDNKIELTLKNNGKDFVKNFNINIIKKYKNKKIIKNIKFNDKINKFKKDSRILLSSKLINNLKKPINRKKYLENINSYFIVEEVLNKARLSLKFNKKMKING